MTARAPFIWNARQPINPAGALAGFFRSKPREEGKNRWFLFRRVVDVEAVPDATDICITVDGRYQLFVNGEWVGRGPVRCTPLDQKFDRYNVAQHLKPGRNVLSVIVHVFGEDKSWYEQVRGMWHATFGDGALWVDGLLVQSDLGWRSIECPAWDRDQPPITHGLPFIESFDARAFPTGWHKPDFDDSDWDQVHILSAGGGGPEAPFGGMVTTPFPILIENPLPPLTRKFVPVGAPYWTRSLTPAPDLPLYRRPYEEVLGPLPDGAINPVSDGWHITSDGVCFLFDMGKLHTGTVTFDLDAQGGEEIEIAVSEQIRGEWDDGGPAPDARIERREMLGLGAHVSRYVARAGQQRFETFFWDAVKWLQIRIKNAAQGATLSRLGVVQTNYPVEERGHFACSDPMLTQLWETGAYTLKLCMHDGWEDCPSREQRQWLGDATVENLVAHVAFGPSAAPLNAKFLKDAAASQRPDGLTQMFAPGNHNVNGLLIPDWTLQWIMNARDHLRWTGDVDTIEAIFPAIQRALGWFEAQLNSHHLVADMPYWHFMDWAGVGRHGEALTLNAQLAGCFDATAAMAQALAMPRATARYRDHADAIRASLNTRHWDDRRGIYVDSVDPRTGAQELRVSQHGNAAMIQWGDVPQNRIAGIVSRITDPARLTFTAAPPITPTGEPLDEEEGVVLANTFYSHFVQCALIKAGRADLVLDLLRQRYGPMLARGATTLWESFEPTASLCHGFSATPTYQMVTGLIGLTPSADGFSELRIAPLPTDLDWIEATLATINGDVTARLERRTTGWAFEATLPSALAFFFVTPSGFRLDTGPETGCGGTHHWVMIPA